MLPLTEVHKPLIIMEIQATSGAARTFDESGEDELIHINLVIMKLYGIIARC